MSALVGRNPAASSARGTVSRAATTRRGELAGARVNYIPNPGMEYGMLGWTGFQGGVMTQDATHVDTGAQAMKLTTPGITFAGGGEGNFTDNFGMGVVAVGQVWSLTMRVWGAGGERIQIGIEEKTASSYLGGNYSTSFTLAAGFQTLTLNGARLSNATVDRLDVSIRTVVSAQAIAIWVDSVICTLGATTDTYFDGDSTGAYWTGTKGRSASVLPQTWQRRGTITRLSTSRAGRPYAGGSSIIPDGDFESGALDPFWQPQSYDGGTGTFPTGTRAVDTTRPHTGAYSLAIHKDAGTSPSQEWGVNHSPAGRTLPSGLYRLGGWMYSTVGNGVAQIQGSLEGVGVFRRYLSAQTANVWTYGETILMVNNSASGAISLRLMIAGTLAAVDAWFDGVFLQPLVGSMRGTIIHAGNHTGVQRGLISLHGTNDRTTMSPEVQVPEYQPPRLGVLVAPQSVPVITGATTAVTLSIPARPEGIGLRFVSARANDAVTIVHPAVPQLSIVLQLSSGVPQWITVTNDFKNISTDDYTVLLSSANIVVKGVSIA